MFADSREGESQGLCPLCGDGVPKARLCGAAFQGTREHDLLLCGTCGLRYLSPLPDDEAIAAFFGDGYHDFDPHRQEGKGLAFARQLRRFKAKGRFLDVGCAMGFFLHGIRQHSDWEVHGTELSRAARRFAREKLDLDVREGPLREAGFPDEHFDYIHVNDVLEHLRDPLGFLTECRRLLKADGRLFLSVPNGAVDCLDLQEFERREGRAGRSKDGHLYFFSARTLRLLFRTLGLRVRRAKTYGFKRGLRSRGLWPRQADWREPYSPRPAEPAGAGGLALAQSPLAVSAQATAGDKSAAAAMRSAVNAQPMVPASRRRSDFYYRFRFLQWELSGLPGLWPQGQDFLFILEKSPPASRSEQPGD